METVISTVTYPVPPVDRKEILRYLSAAKETEELELLINESLKESESALSFKVCYGEFPVRRDGDSLDFGFCKITSADLSKNLNDCRRAVVFAATVGIKLDMLINKYSRISPAKALVLQAIGNERIETLCDVFNAEIARKHGTTRPRFSPGYGDLPLKIQCDIFKTLDCGRNLGLTLNESLLMSPQKSVTAIIGID